MPLDDIWRRWTQIAAAQQTWAQTHGPVYEGAHVDRAVELMRAVPAGPAVPQPGHADLDALVASMLVAARDRVSLRRAPP